MDCKHEFIGHENGVTCCKCGISMTAQEYMGYLHGVKPVQKSNVPADAPKRTTRKKKVE